MNDLIDRLGCGISDLFAALSREGDMGDLVAVHAGLLGVVLTVVSIVPVLASDRSAFRNDELLRQVGGMWWVILVHGIGLLAALVGLAGAEHVGGPVTWAAAFIGVALLTRVGIFLAHRLVEEVPNE